MREDFASEMRGPRLAGAVTAAVGLITLALACLGIFGTVSFSVALRTKEIGVRLALGAGQPALLRALMRTVLTPVGVGIVLGVGMAAAIGAALRAEPFFLEHVDPIAFAGGVLVLCLAGALAALLPASAMLRKNPIDALRHS
jgi:ABC-type antimicrobial peptide transport system permease subunit